MSEIEKIASAHLGKTSSGEVSAPYVTPKHIDSTLLVALPRYHAREKNNINIEGMKGTDIWNCYEVSYMSPIGIPQNFIVQINISAEAGNTVESKSLKLYLNSFNLAVIKSPKELHNIIKLDLENLIGINAANVEVFDLDSYRDQSYIDISTFVSKDVPNIFNYPSLEKSTDSLVIRPQTQLSHVEMDYVILQNLDVKKAKPYKVRSSLLRSNCRVTNQPDWADVFIYMDFLTENERVRSNLTHKQTWANYKYPDSRELLQYIISFRNENHFHEEVCETIFNKLRNDFEPAELLVGCFYTRRGGIDINPIRATSQKIIDTEIGNMFPFRRTVRQ